MKVKELIEQLQKLNPEGEVCVSLCPNDNDEYWSKRYFGEICEVMNHLGLTVLVCDEIYERE